MSVRRAWLGVLLAPAIAGCGSTPLSVTQLRSSATRLCAVAQRQGEAIRGPAPSATGAPSAVSTAAFLRSGIVVIRRERAELQTLRPPISSKGQYRTALDALSGQLQELTATQQRLSTGEDPLVAVKLLQQRLTPLEQNGSAAWQALGIPPCAGQ